MVEKKKKRVTRKRPRKNEIVVTKLQEHWVEMLTSGSRFRMKLAVHGHEEMHALMVRGAKLIGDRIGAEVGNKRRRRLIRELSQKAN